MGIFAGVRRRDEWRAFALLCLAVALPVTIPYAISQPDVRHRLAIIDPLWMIAGALALETIMARWRRERALTAGRHRNGFCFTLAAGKPPHGLAVSYLSSTRNRSGEHTKGKVAAFMTEFGNRWRRGLTSSAMIVLVVVSTGCGAFRSLERTTSNLVFPTGTEAAIGNQYAEQIEQEFTMVQDSMANAWLDDVGARLVEHSPETPHEFRFNLTTSEEVNAFAIPGGHCYVNLGLLLYADNEAQVAAVVGHEVNHVTMRHGILQAQRGMGLGVATSVVAGVFQSPAAQAAAAIAGQGGSFLATRSFGRDDEREADKYGVQAMYEAGWDPREAAVFFEKLNELSGGEDPSMLQNIISTHPPTTERVENIREQVARYDLTVPLIVNTPQFQEVQSRMRRLYESGQTTKTSVGDVQVPVPATENETNYR